MIDVFDREVLEDIRIRCEFRLKRRERYERKVLEEGGEPPGVAREPNCLDDCLFLLKVIDEELEDG